VTFGVVGVGFIVAAIACTVMVAMMTRGMSDWRGGGEEND